MHAKKCRSSRPVVFCKEDVLENFAIFTDKHLHWSLLKKVTLAQVSSCKFCEVFKNTYFSEHLQTATSRSEKPESLTSRHIKSIRSLKLNSD